MSLPTCDDGRPMFSLAPGYDGASTQILGVTLTPSRADKVLCREC